LAAKYRFLFFRLIQHHIIQKAIAIYAVLWYNCNNHGMQLSMLWFVKYKEGELRMLIHILMGTNRTRRLF